MIPVASLCLLAGCGGGSPSGPSGPGTTLPPSVPTHPVSGVVYYDENANGRLDPGEDVRLPSVAVSVGGQQATTVAGGRFTVPAVPAGTRDALGVLLPPFFRPGAAIPVSVPTGAGFEVAVPAVLPIQQNRPNTFLAFGDSITKGDGSKSRDGYRGAFSSAIRSFWGGPAIVIEDGVESTQTPQGAERLGASLARFHPAYALILYGTNDWNEFYCRNAIKCGTVNYIRSMIQQCKAAGTVPVVGTIIPANPAYEDRQAFQRNAWIEEMNGYIRPAVKEEGGVLADTDAAFRAAAGTHLQDYFADHVHPNDEGYAIIAQEFFRAVTTPVPASATGFGPAARN